MTDSTPSPDPIDQKITYLVTLIRDLATPVLGKATLGSLDKLAARTQTPAVRAIVAGEVSRGKSTLINALIGRPILPDAAGALTSTWTVVQHGPQLMAEATIITPKPQSTGRVWMVAGRNQRPADLTLAADRAWAFRRLPVLQLVRDFWLGVGVRVAAEGRRGAVTGSGLVRPRLRAARRRRTGSATRVHGASRRAGAA